MTMVDDRMEDLEAMFEGEKPCTHARSTATTTARRQTNDCILISVRSDGNEPENEMDVVVESRSGVGDEDGISK